MKWLKSCDMCGKEHYVRSDRYSMYCSNACKQKAYRQRKNKQKKAREEMRDMLVFGKVDQLMEYIPDGSKDEVSNFVWKVLDMVKDVDTQIAVANLIRYYALKAKAG